MGFLLLVHIENESCGEQPSKIRMEFQVSNCTTNEDFKSSVASIANGEKFVVVWWGNQLDGSNDGVYAQIYFSNDGSKVGSEFQVNSNTDRNQLDPSIASIENGEKFVITWSSNHLSEDRYDVFAQIYFSNDGSKVGSEFLVSESSGKNQQSPSVASIGNDRFVIAWENLDYRPVTICAQIFNSTDFGTIGSIFQVETKSHHRAVPSVSSSQIGNQFVIAWESLWQDGDGSGIYAQIFDGTDSPMGPEFQVNSYTIGDQKIPCVAYLSNDNFVITWESLGQDGDGSGIYAQIFDGTDSRVGSEFQVNSYTDLDQGKPHVSAFTNNDNFVITWESLGQDRDGSGIYAQIFDGPNSRVGTEFQANNETNLDQSEPCVATIPNDEDVFVITWESEGQDVDRSVIMAQSFDASSRKCYCKIGYYEDTPDNCLPCEAGTFQTQTGQSSCQNCPEGEFQNQTGSTFCSKCDPGWFQNETQSTSCNECGLGTFTNEYVGTITCNICTVGEFQNETGASLCDKCDMGYYQDQTGQSKCLVCGAGTFSNEVGMSSCTECQPGTFQDQTNSKLCHVCEEGTYQNANKSTSCFDCQAGSYQDKNGSAACMECPIGSFQSQNGSVQCEVCSQGSYSDIKGLSACYRCPKGTINDKTNQTSISACQKCPKGSYSSELGSTACTLCANGTFSENDGSTVCVNCRTGSYSTNDGATTCIECKEGFYGLQEGKSNFQDACDFCPAGTWSNQTGLSNIGECTNCMAGFYNEDLGKTSILNCWPCLRGTYNATEGLSDSGGCTNCNSNQVSLQEASTSCLDCPLGYEPNQQQDKCIPCERGYYKNSTKTNCERCLENTITIEEGSLKCKKCADLRICNGGFECMPGRDPYSYCSKCKSGYSKKGNSCKKCPPFGVLYIWISLIVLAVILMIVFKKRVKKLLVTLKQASVIVTIISLQFFTTIVSMNLNWPDFMSSSFVHASTGVFNLNLEMMFSTQCFRSFNFYDQWLILVLVSLCPLFILFVTWFIGWFAFKKKKKWLKKKTSKKIKYSVIFYGTLMLKYFYIPISLICIEPFATTYQPEFKEYTLNTDPNLSTSDQKYKTFYPWFIFFLIFYVGLIPVTLILLLFLAKRKKFSQIWEQKIGWIWEFYKPNRFWWEIIEIIFKLLLMLSSVMFSTKKTAHSIYLVCLFSVQILLVLLFKPRIITTTNTNPDTQHTISIADKLQISISMIIISFICLTFDNLDMFLFMVFYALGVCGLTWTVKEPILFSLKNRKKLNKPKNNDKYKSDIDVEKKSRKDLKNSISNSRSGTNSPSETASNSNSDSSNDSDSDSDSDDSSDEKNEKKNITNDVETQNENEETCTSSKEEIELKEIPPNSD
ncbi:insulin-like growth factor binding protein [Anaeramoeba flamelloides]|uniref:Insulin-like growth factor binding protein n=1 Tax=Anaeramoeba flamelloides TaxID=1746091 RepID=A0ABQ8YVQ3_9EUKA|nr:insulin-like growth factor binding protein [Anaeramoeba flamelloides]